MKEIEYVLKPYEDKNLHIFAEPSSFDKTKHFCNNKEIKPIKTKFVKRLEGESFFITHSKDLLKDLNLTIPEYIDKNEYENYDDNIYINSLKDLNLTIPEYIDKNEYKNYDDNIYINSYNDFSKNLFVNEVRNFEIDECIKYLNKLTFDSFKNNLICEKINDRYILSLEKSFLKITGELKNAKDLEDNPNSTIKKANFSICIEYIYDVCPICNEKINSRYNELTNLIGEYIYDNENSIKHTLIFKESKYNRKTKLAYCRVYKKIYIFKKDSLTMYKIKNKHMFGNNYLKKINPCIILNSTYSLDKFEDNYCEKYENMILEYLKNKNESLYNYTKKDFKNMDLDYKDNYNNSYFISIFYIKSVLNINSTLLACYIYQARMYDNKLMSKLKGLKEKEIFKYLKVSNKDILYLISTKGYYKMQNLSLVFYKELCKDNLRKLYDLEYIVSVSKDKKKCFLYQYLKNVSEKRFINQVLKERFYILSDTDNLFKKIKEIDKNYKINWSLNIEEIHDTLSIDYDKMKHPDLEIPKTNKIEKIVKNLKFENIKYITAKTTHELINTGSKMHICVGSYDTKAVNRNCYIVIGYDENDNPVTCIELNDERDKIKVNQVKKYRNEYPLEDEATYLFNAFKEEDLLIKTFDLKKAKNFKMDKEDLY